MYLFNIRRKHVEGGTITKRSIEDADVSLSVSSTPYTGEPITPSVNVIVGNTLLSPNVDFTVEYLDNVEVGLATIRLRGTGNYYGEKSVSFYITSGGMKSWNFNLGNAVHVSTKNVSLWSFSMMGDSVVVGLHGSGRYLEVGNIDNFDMSTYNGAVTSSVASGRDFVMSADGETFVGVSTVSVSNAIYTAQATTKLDPRTLGAWSDKIQVVGSPTQIRHAAFANGGKKLFLTSYDTLRCVTLATPYSIGTSTDVNSSSISCRCFAVAPDGKVVVTCASDGTMSFYRMSKAFDISTAVLDHSATPANPSGLKCTGQFAINSEGTRMIMHNGNTGSHISFRLE